MLERHVMCVKLGRELPGLAYVPMPGPLGIRIYESVSREAWQAWVKQSTMVMNEYRLNPADPADQETLIQHMTSFLFGEGDVVQLPGFVPKESCSD